MRNIFKNPEVKSVILKLLILQTLFAVFVLIFIRYESNKLNAVIVDQNNAIIGKVLSKYPELEEEIIPIVTKGASTDEIIRGKEILRKYSYNNDMPITSQVGLNNFYQKMNQDVLMILVVYLILLVLTVLFEYRKIFNSINNISFAAERVVEGKYDSNIPEGREGDLAILGHNFNIMSNRLKLGIERLKEDKVFLKNIISDISHQLKTPLASLIMFNEILLDNKDLDKNQREDFLEKSNSQLNRMEWLIINLLKMTRLEAGAIEFNRKSGKLINCVEKAIAVLNSKIKEKNQEMIIKGNTEGAIFRGDEEWTTEAVINILKNCIEHTGSGGKVRFEFSDTPIFSRLTITDEGEGIDKKDIPYVFERFYRGSSSTKVESVGIGLALSKLIIEGQGGIIMVQSEKGNGAIFTITFLKGIV